MTESNSDFIVTESGCWEWAKYRDRNGYGRAYSKDRGVDWAHRYYFALHKGEIPAGHEIDHLCCNPPCVNPEHLEAVTKAVHAQRTWDRLGKSDRHLWAAYLRQMHLTYGEIAQVLGYRSKTGACGAVQRAVEKGLVDAGSIPPAPKLLAHEREEIRDLYEMGVPQADLAQWYGVDNSNISRTITGARRRKPRAA